MPIPLGTSGREGLCPVDLLKPWPVDIAGSHRIPVFILIMDERGLNPKHRNAVVMLLKEPVEIPPYAEMENPFTSLLSVRLHADNDSGLISSTRPRCKRNT